MSFLAIDFGEKKTGFAISDISNSFAVPLPVFRYTALKELSEKTIYYIKTFKIEKIILGFPKRENGLKSNTFKLVEKFIQCLNYEESFYEFIDESYSSKFLKTNKEIPKKVDSLVAKHLLEIYLEKYEKV